MFSDLKGEIRPRGCGVGLLKYDMIIDFWFVDLRLSPALSASLTETSHAFPCLLFDYLIYLFPTLGFIQGAVNGNLSIIHLFGSFIKFIVLSMIRPQYHGYIVDYVIKK